MLLVDPTPPGQPNTADELRAGAPPDPAAGAHEAAPPSARPGAAERLVSFILLFDGSLIRRRSVSLLLKRQIELDHHPFRRSQWFDKTLKLVCTTPPTVLAHVDPPKKRLPAVGHARAQLAGGYGVETTFELLHADRGRRLGVSIDPEPELVAVLRNAGRCRWIVEAKDGVRRRVSQETSRACPRAQQLPRIMLRPGADRPDPRDTRWWQPLDTNVELSHACRVVARTRH